MAFSDEEILEELAEATGHRTAHAHELLDKDSFLFRQYEPSRERQTLTKEELLFRRRNYVAKFKNDAWYQEWRRRDNRASYRRTKHSERYRRRAAKARLTYYYRTAMSKRRKINCEKQLLKYLNLYLTFHPDEAKRAHVVALLQLFQPNAD